MFINLSAAVTTHVRQVIAQLSKKAVPAVQAELRQLVDAHGAELFLFVIRQLFDTIDLRVARGREHPAAQLLAAELALLPQKANFSAIACQLADDSDMAPGELLGVLGKHLRIPLLAQFAFALGMCESRKAAIASEGALFLGSQLNEFLHQASRDRTALHVAHHLLLVVAARPHRFEGFGAVTAQIRKEFGVAEGALLLKPLAATGEGAASQGVTLPDPLRRDDDLAFARRLAAACQPGDLLSNLSPRHSASVDQLREVLEQFAPLTESHVAHIVGMLAAASTPDVASRWNVDVVVETVRRLQPKLNWQLVIRQLDYPGFFVTCAEGVQLVLAAYRRATNGAEFPVECVYQTWNNVRGQLSLLRHALSTVHDGLNFAQLPHRAVEAVPPRSAPAHTVHWVSLDLTETLLSLALSEQYVVVKSLLAAPMQHCPEVLLSAFAQLKPHWNPLAMELSEELMAGFIGAFPASAPVLHKVWKLDQAMLVHGLVKAHMDDPTLLPKLLDIAQELKALGTVLEARPFAFAIDLAALAGRREFLNVDKWLQEHLHQYRDTFVYACVEFLAEKLGSEQQQQQQQQQGLRTRPTNIQLSPEVAVIFFKCLLAHQCQNRALHDEIRQLHAQASKLFPKLESLVEQQATETFPPEVEDESNSLFKQLFGEQISVDDLVTKLKQFMVSTSPHQQKVYTCMLRNLFDECRFFHKYPDKELRISGVLFGMLIQHQLIASLWLGIALRYILDSLKKPITSKMFRFGVCALEHFKSRLQEWPQYCSHIERVEQLGQDPAGAALLDYIRRLGRDAAAAAASGGSAAAAAGGPPPGLSGPAVGQSAYAAGNSSNSTALANAAAVNASFSGVSVTGATTLASAGASATSKLMPEGAAVQPLGAPPGLAPLPTAAAAAAGASASSAAGGASLTAAAVAAAAAGSASGPSSLASSIPSILRTPNKGQGQAGPAGFATSLNIDTLLGLASTASYPLPDDSVQDRVHFLFNNLSAANVEQKAEEMQQLLEEQYYAFFAHYLVVRRASMELNFHSLYMQFLDKFNRPAFMRALLHTTYENIRALLQSDKAVSSTSERTLLKNLGNWLGLITIAKNRMILARDLELKELIIYAYESGRLIAILPFVCKILDACRLSRVIRPPNPWVLGLLSLLAELHSLPDLKMNLKFEVVYVCKSLSVELSELKPTSILRNRPVDKVTSVDFVTKEAPSAAEFAGPASAPSALAMQQPGGVPTPQRGGYASGSAAAAAAAGVPPGVPSAAAAAAAAAGAAGVLPSIASMVRVPEVEPFVRLPASRRHVAAAVERAVRDIITPVVDRSVTIARITARILVAKDFASDPDDARLMGAAHAMVRSLAGSLALVTCKEPLRLSITNTLKAIFQADEALKQLSPAVVEAAIAATVQENLDSACYCVELAAVEKAHRDVEEAIAPDLALRKQHREKGLLSADSHLLAGGRLSADFPEQLRPSRAGVSAAQVRLYEEFANVFKLEPDPAWSAAATAQAAAVAALAARPPVQGAGAGGIDTSAGAGGAPAPSGKAADAPTSLSSSDVVMKLRGFFEMLMRTLHALGPLQLTSLPPEHELRKLLTSIITLLKQVDPRTEISPNVSIVQFLVQLLVLPPTNASYPVQLQCMMLLLEVCKSVSRNTILDVTKFLLMADEQSGVHFDIVARLVHSQLIVLPQLDAHVAAHLMPQNAQARVDNTLMILRKVLVQDMSAGLGDFGKSLELLAKLVQSGAVGGHYIAVFDDIVALSASSAAAAGAAAGSGPGVVSVSGVGGSAAGSVASSSSSSYVTSSSAAAAAAAAAAAGGAQRVYEGDAAFRMQVSHVFRDWYQSARNSPHDLHAIAVMQRTGLLEGDEISVKFFRAAIDMCLDQVDSTNGTEEGFAMLARLIVVLVKVAPDLLPGLRISLVSKFLNACVLCLLREHDSNAARFHRHSFQRVLSDVLNELLGTENVPAPVEDQLLALFGSALSSVQPERAPSFAFEWVELVGHRAFLPRLIGNKSKGWPILQRLLTALLSFLEPFLRNVLLSDSIQLLYKGTLRVLLVLLHDYPEFLCEYHLSFCDVIAPTCIQLRNLVLSAYPQNMRPPDPFTPHLKVDLLPEIQIAPVISSNFIEPLTAAGMQTDLINYLRSPQTSSFLQDLRLRLELPPSEAQARGTKFNVPLLNAVVLYVGIQAIHFLQSKGQHNIIAHNAPMELFNFLANSLEPEACYLFLNGVANQLRYPNSHTHYFSWVLLCLFYDARSEQVQEQITRVLLERLIVNRPHPWGLLVTFIELIKNPRYNFWSHKFTRCAPEIERLFDFVARNCMGVSMSGRGPVSEDGSRPQ